MPCLTLVKISLWKPNKNHKTDILLCASDCKIDINSFFKGEIEFYVLIKNIKYVMA